MQRIGFDLLPVGTKGAAAGSALFDT
ncbi:hypothetical protein CNECB9_620046 [Cupriavidus necator]|uniref:Uncharacterized protein n=1 Tax=Cupriavidus necator TaxID=106590 RepID=A0A1K0JYU8_CUPNE|nr:hypothetical protein CNECB9_620046 [Cupriavidus necator]